MDTTTDTRDEVLESPTRGQAALHAIQPMLATLGEKELMVINVDLSAAAIGAIGVAERARESTLLTRLQRLPLDEFDHAQVDLLIKLGWATLHLATRFSQPRGRKLPATLVEQGITVETRMQICCEYHLGDIPEARAVLERPRPGIGYRDLAGYLLGYAELYRIYRGIEPEREPKAVTVEIMGRTLALRVEASPEELKRVAHLVDEQLRQLQRAFPASPLTDLAILAALNLACECLEIKEDYQQLNAKIEERSRHLIQLLEAHETYAPPGP